MRSNHSQGHDLAKTRASQPAREAIDAAIGSNRQSTNLVCLHGPSGSGKSALLAFAAQSFRRRHPSGTCGELNGEELIDSLIESIQDGTGRRWRRSLLAFDALIIDDLTAVRKQQCVGAELLWLVRKRYHEGRVNLMTITTSPDEQWDPTDLGPLEPGVHRVELGPPDLEDRVLIAHEMCRGIEPAVDDASLRMIAELSRTASEVRGLVTAVGFYAAQWGEPISADLCRWVASRQRGTPPAA